MRRPTAFTLRMFVQSGLGNSTLWILGLALSLAGIQFSNAQVTSSELEPQPEVPHAVAEHDIAPWDGPAFGVWIPAEKFGGKPDSWIYLRIWDAPEQAQKRYEFPDKAMKVGVASYCLKLRSPESIDWRNQPYEELKGWVRFSRSGSDKPILGEFDFTSEKKTSLKGKFEAKWITKGWLDK